MAYTDKNGNIISGQDVPQVMLILPYFVRTLAPLENAITSSKKS